jgi:hypothetical protein
MKSLDEFKRDAVLAKAVMDSGSYNEIHFFNLWKGFNQLLEYAEIYKDLYAEQVDATKQAEEMHKDAVLDKRQYRLTLEALRKGLGHD